MAIYNSLLPCTIVLTLPLGAWFVLSGMSNLPDLIPILCLSLSIGIPLLKALGFLPTLPQLNYKISALEQMLEAEPLKQGDNSFQGDGHAVTYRNICFGYGEQMISVVISVIKSYNLLGDKSEELSGSFRKSRDTSIGFENKMLPWTNGLNIIYAIGIASIFGLSIVLQQSGALTLAYQDKEVLKNISFEIP